MGHKKANETVHPKGFVKLTNVKADGTIQVNEFTNLVTNGGKAQLAALFLSDVGGTAFDYVAIGTSSTAPNATDSALGAELYRTASTCVRTTTSVANDTAFMTGSINITGTATIAEIGIFNSASGGILFSRATTSQAVEDGDTLNYQYSVVFS